ncbi:MAG: phytanoyl-CoA dioxygenase family protein [Armatimonadetes bacterium]|nr:phytanoyl-CoA dioxygenase family protein [Armatimonadota bacterium]
MKMSYAQKKQFFEEGYIVIPGAVPQVTVREARKAINASLGQGMDAEQMTKFRAQSYCPEVQRSEAITNLVMKTPVWDIAESMLGEGNLLPVTGGQIALRFPTMQDPPPISGPHLDGMYTPTNGVEKGKITNFTLLAVVLLSDLTETFAGNFTLWPRTHNPYQEYFREHGPEAILEGMPKIESMPSPVQIVGRAGDVCLTHYQIAHTAMCNASDSIRYAAIFRLYHKDHSEQMAEVLTDIWKEWDGMRDFAPR